MALYKATFFFQQGENGWSEGWHTPLTDLPSIIGAVNRYVGFRLGVLQEGAQLTHIRVSDDLTFRDVLIDPAPLPRKGTGQGNPKTLGLGSPFVALDITAQTNPVITKHLFMRGIPQGQTDDVAPSYGGAYALAIGQFLTYLKAGDWGIKAKDRSQVKQPIASINAAGLVSLTFPLGTLPVGPPAPIVQILGVKRSLVPIRTYQVVNVTSASSFTLRGWGGQVLSNVGYIRLVQYTITAPLITAVIDAVTERRVGRPFGVQRGRRAVVR
jgi:hypothetical protein